MIDPASPAAVGWWYLGQVNPTGDPGEPCTFTVLADDTSTRSRARLQEQGLISDAWVFRWYVEHHGGLEIDAGLLPAAPQRPHGQRASARLRTPPSPDVHQGHVPRGLHHRSKMADRLSRRKPRLTRGGVHAPRPTGDRSKSAYRPPGVTSLEGLLFPDTYQVSNADERRLRSSQRMIDADGARRRPGGHRHQGRNRRPLAVPGPDHRLDDRDGGQGRRGPPEDRPRHLQPARSSACRCRSTPRCLRAAARAPSPTAHARQSTRRTTRTCTPGSRRRRSPTPVGRRSRLRSTRRRTRRSGDPICQVLPDPTKDCHLPVLRRRQRGRRPRVRGDARTARSQRAARPRPRAARMITGATRVGGRDRHRPCGTACRRRCTTPPSHAPGSTGVYVAFEVRRATRRRRSRRCGRSGIGGLSVTMPHKDDVAAAVDELDPAASCAASREHGGAARRRIDWSATAPTAPASSPRWRRAASTSRGVRRRACSAPAARRGRSSTRSGAPARSTIVVVNRTPNARPRPPRAGGAIGTGRHGPDDVADADLSSTPRRSAWVPTSCRSTPVRCVPATSSPTSSTTRSTRRCCAAAEQPARTAVDGLGMLVHQAVLQQELWTGVRPDPAVHAAAAEAELASRLSRGGSVTSPGCFGFLDRRRIARPGARRDRRGPPRRARDHGRGDPGRDGAAPPRVSAVARASGSSSRRADVASAACATGARSARRWRSRSRTPSGSAATSGTRRCRPRPA